MADELTLPNHLTTRKGVFQYVRRVPEDLREDFPFARVQKSLGTRDSRKARAAALDLDIRWDVTFGQARERRGVAVDDTGRLATRTTGWSWPDWEALASWFGASLAEEDWRARLGAVKGAALGREPDLRQLPWRDDATVKEHIARRKQLEGWDVATYAAERVAFIQSYIRRVGVTLSRADQSFERFTAACLGAELAYLDTFFAREARQGGLDHAHPDSIAGPWRPLRLTAAAKQAEPSTAQQAAGEPTGRVLAHCRAKWVENRQKNKKQVRADYLRDMDQTIAAFEAHARVTDLGQIRRRHVLAFRDHLSSTAGYKVATVNKKVGFISALVRTAANAGWVEDILGKNLFLELPEDEGAREPFQMADLRGIFSHPTFTAGVRSPRAKACQEVQYWLPVIACLHGMISSEILQLGPDTVRPHPDAPDVLCFEVTNAGDRRIKTLARRRWVPVRRELVGLGLDRLVSEARSQERAWLWPAMTEADGDVTRVSGYFSSFWAAFSRREMKLAPGLSLYSFRHAFQDALGRAGHGEDVKKALMGHAETGMTKNYGTKSRPREINIRDLDAAVQGLHWPFLAGLRSAIP